MSDLPKEGFPSSRASAWPPRLQRTKDIRLLNKLELQKMILFEDEDLLVLNKPGDIVCHPSKAGPWSSLVGAVRECMALDKVHLVFRLDRETSGVVIFARHSTMASRLQRGIQERKVGKRYLTLLSGSLESPVRVDQSLGPDIHSMVYIKSAVVPPDEAGAQRAVTRFFPVQTGKRFSLVEAVLETGRKHQIRAHAQWLGHPVVGDKIYGPDEHCYLEFIESGWSAELERRLLFSRQALHCAEIDLRPAGVDKVFRAPLAEDIRDFWKEHEEHPLTFPLIDSGMPELAQKAHIPSD